RKPGYDASRLCSASFTVAPSTVTSALPLVSRRRGPGTRTVTGIAGRVYGEAHCQALGRRVQLHDERAARRSRRCAADQVVEDELRPRLHAQVLITHRVEQHALALELVR